MFILDGWGKNTPVNADKARGPVSVAVPARFDFIGGWTDTPPYYFDNKACVLNSTLSLPASGASHDGEVRAIEVAVQPAGYLSVIENGIPVSDLKEHLIIRAIMDFMELANPPIRISISNSIPKGSGLGGSSLLTSAVLAALYGYYNGIDTVALNIRNLVNQVLLIEQLMESGGGWQDQIGGLFPGVKLITTNPEYPCCYHINYLDTGIELLDDSSLVIDTRIQRKAARILYSIRQKYVDRDPAALHVLNYIAGNAPLGFRYLKEGNIHSFAEILSESWEMVNSIESGSVEIVERLKNFCGRDLLGAKIGGAGGGGFLLAIFENREIREYYSKRIRDVFANCLVHEPRFGGSGMLLRQETAAGSQVLHIGFTPSLTG